MKKRKVEIKKVKTTAGPIRGKYSHAIADAKATEKRAQAEARQAARSKRTDAEQLAKLNRSGHKAVKERARLK